MAARETADLLHTRMIVALGDMLELGELAPMMHIAAVRDVLAARPAQFIAVGREFDAAIKSLADCSGIPLEVHTAHDSPEAATILRRVIRRGDVLLVKGSRAIAMEHVIDNLSAI